MQCLQEFPTKRDSATFWDKGTKVPSLSWDKEQVQNLAKGQNGPEQPVKIWDGTRDGTRDGTVRDFDNLSRDKGTPGQETFFVPGQRDNGMSRPGLS